MKGNESDLSFISFHFLSFPCFSFALFGLSQTEEVAGSLALDAENAVHGVELRRGAER
jgi:hypothetical protein